MSKKIAAAREAVVGLRTWSLCWQTALARSFLVHPSMTDKIRSKLLKLHREHGRVLVDFVILPTEILTITQVQPGDTVYNVAAPFGNQLAKWVQEHERVRSPLLAGPYSRQLLETDDEIRQEVRMMSWRPVLKGKAYAPDRDPNGALRSALGGNAARLFDPMPLLGFFGTGVNPSRDALRDWLRKPPSDEEWRAWELSRGLRLATGTSGPHPFMAKKVTGMAAAFVAAGGSDTIEGALELLEIGSAPDFAPRRRWTCVVASAPYPPEDGAWWRTWRGRCTCARQRRWRATSTWRGRR